MPLTELSRMSKDWKVITYHIEEFQLEKPMQKPNIILNLIFVTAIASIFLVIISGAGDRNPLSESEFNPFCASVILIEKEKISQNDKLEFKSDLNNNEVPFAECAVDSGIDTGWGHIHIGYDIPDILPLTITEDYLDNNFAITAVVFGGFIPDGYSALAIIQANTSIERGVLIEWIYVGTGILDEPTNPYHGYAYNMYVADFILTDPIILELNTVPTISSAGIDLQTYCPNSPLPDGLDRSVTVGVVSNWKAVDGVDQQFQI